MAKSFYIKKRENPQLGVYYILKGQMTQKESKIWEDTVYGCNTMLRYPSKEEYDAAVKELISSGARISNLPLTTA